MQRFFPWIAAVGLGAALGAGAAGVAWQERRHAARIGPSGPPPRAGAARAVSGDRPNVVLVIGCTVRRDQLSPYGGNPATTPFLGELAVTGARFDDAIGAAPWTKAAGTAIVTGQPFRGVGMAETSGPGNSRRLAPEATSLAQVFRDAGYWTIGATASPSLDAAFGFDAGFERYRNFGDLWRDGMTRVPGAFVVDRSLREIDRRAAREAPVFVQLVLTDARPPGEVDENALSAFGDGSAPTRVVRYRALLHRFDAALRRLWNGLEARGFDDSNTLFVVIGDHGEGLSWPPEQGAGHGNSLAPAVLEMAWLVRGRGVGAGATVSGLASQIDVFPTITGLAGVPGYEGPGEDWSRLLASGGSTHRALAFADTDFERADKSAVYSVDRSCERSVRRDEAVVRCYDRKADPFHRKPLSSNDPALVGALDEWRAAQDAAATAWGWTSNAALPPETAALLDRLGYVMEGRDPG